MSGSSLSDEAMGLRPGLAFCISLLNRANSDAKALLFDVSTSRLTLTRNPPSRITCVLGLLTALSYLCH